MSRVTVPNLIVMNPILATHPLLEFVQCVTCVWVSLCFIWFMRGKPMFFPFYDFVVSMFRPVNSGCQYAEHRLLISFGFVGVR